MLSMQVLKSAGSAADYYTEAVNYYKDDATAMRWLGKGAEHLELGNDIQKEQLLALLNGELPNGQTLGKVEVNKETNEKIRKHRPGFDMTFSAPKSLSVLIGLNQKYSNSFLKMHDDAVKWALSEVEREFASTRIKKNGKIHYVQTGNLTIGACRHATSRANDPAIHTHALVLNFTFDGSGKASSLASDMFGNRGVIEAIGKNTVYIGALYRYKVAENLIKAGFTLELTQKGLFEIAGFPKEILSEFSKRSEEILEYIDKHGLSGSKAKDFAALETRKGKTDKPLDVLVKQWCLVVEELGYDPLSLTDTIKSHVQKEYVTNKFEQIKTTVFNKIFGQSKAKIELDETIAIEAINFATKSITQSKEVFSDRELKAKAIEHLIGQNKIIDLKLIDLEVKRLTKDKQLIVHQSEIANEKKIVTIDSSKMAIEAIEMIHEEKGKVAPICSVKEVVDSIKKHNEKSKYPLTKSQNTAISKILTSKDRVIAIQGYAGTGKTTMLKLSKELAELKISNELAGDNGYELKGITIATSARNELIKKAHIDSDVYDAAINKIKASKKDLSKTIYIVDESSMISSSQANELVHLIKEKNSRLIFVGDRAQLKSVNEGRFFEMGQLYGMETVEMIDIVRQINPNQLEAAKHASQGNIYDALNQLERVSELDSHENRIKFFAQSYLDMSQTQRERTLLFAAKHNTIKKITGEIRSGLQKDGTLSGAKFKHEILNRINIDSESAKFNSNYRAGNIIKFNKAVKQYKINQGEYLTVAPITRSSLKTNTLHLLRENGSKINFPVESIPVEKRANNSFPQIELYSKSELELQLNDKIVFTKSDNKEGIANSNVGTITRIDNETISIKLNETDLTKTFNKNSSVLKHLGHGYVLTNYKVQGKDEFAGIAFIESSDRFACDLSNFYVQITRATYSMSIVTDDKNAIIKTIELNNTEKSSVLDFLTSTELKEIEQQGSWSSSTSYNNDDKPRISNVIKITELREEEVKENVVKLVEDYREQKEIDSENQDVTRLSESAYKIISSKSAYKYAQKTLKYSYQAYRYDSIGKQVEQLQESLNPDEKNKLKLVIDYAKTSLNVQGSINKLSELKDEANKSNELKNEIFKEQFEYKLERNKIAYEISKKIESFGDYLKVYSIGQLNRAGVPQYKYRDEEQKSIGKLTRLVSHASEYEHYLAVESYLKGEHSGKDRFAYDLLENKKGLSANVFHFANKLSITTKDIYWQLYADANIHKEHLFYNDLTMKERSCFNKVKQYKDACRDVAKSWGGISEFIKNNEAVPESLQLKLNDLTSSRSQLAANILPNDDFQKSLDFFNVDPNKKSNHENKHIKKEVVDGLLSSSKHTVQDKLHFAKHIADNFKSYYPAIKSSTQGQAKLYFYTNYIAKNDYKSSLSDTQKTHVKALSHYKSISNKAAVAWKQAFKLKELNDNGMPISALEKAVFLSAERDYKASLIDIDQLESKAFEIYHVKESNILKHKEAHIKKVSEIYNIKGKQKKLLHHLQNNGINYNKSQTKSFNEQWRDLLSNSKLKEQQFKSYYYALKAVPISDVTLTKKHKETVIKYDLKFEKNISKSVFEIGMQSDNQPNFYDVEAINSSLNIDPVTTYKSIFGEPKSISSKEMRYSGGLVVSLSGRKKGAWFDFTAQEGGWPIQAIEKSRGVEFKEAIKIAAELASISPELRVHAQQDSHMKYTKASSIIEAKIIENRVKSAKSIWDNSIPLDGTLGEKYLVKHRGIKDVSSINARFLPANTIHMNTDENGNLIKKTNKFPAITFPATNKRGYLKAVQRIFLDPETGEKNGFMSNAKLSKGVVPGNGIIIQKGDKKHPVFISEGPETGASIANSFPSSTVISSMGLYNIKNLPELCKSLGNKTVIFAADNDGVNSIENDKVMAKAAINFESNDFKTISFKPTNIENNKKTDWNDIIIKRGANHIRQVFLKNISNKYSAKQLGNDFVYDINKQIIIANNEINHQDISVKTSPIIHNKYIENGLDF